MHNEETNIFYFTADHFALKIITEVGTMLQPLLAEIGTLKQMLSGEKQQRQEMEARLQANLDFINQNISNNSTQTAVIDDDAMDEQFKLPIIDAETVPQFDTFLRQSANFKESLVSLFYSKSNRSSNFEFCSHKNFLDSVEKIIMQNWELPWNALSKTWH